MPEVRKVTNDEVAKTTLPEKKKRGRPVGSKNKKTVDTTAFETEKLYVYKAADGCETQSALKSKTITFYCKHHKLMELCK